LPEFLPSPFSVSQSRIPEPLCCFNHLAKGLFLL
jgi:hypothetical protein